MKRIVVWAGIAATLAMAGCAEKAQVAATKKADGKPWEGTQSGYAAAGWKAGDAASWEEQMKTRSQGQNEYTRAPAKP